MAVISVTRLRLRLLDYRPAFLEYADRAYAQAKQTPGNIHTITRSQTKTVYWTLSALEDEASMQTYMMAGTHREAMLRIVEWSDEASVVHWNQDSSNLPSWDVAEQRMVEYGKFSPL